MPHECFVICPQSDTYTQYTHPQINALETYFWKSARARSHNKTPSHYTAMSECSIKPILAWLTKVPRKYYPYTHTHSIYFTFACALNTHVRFIAHARIHDAPSSCRVSSYIYVLVCSVRIYM